MSGRLQLQVCLCDSVNHPPVCVDGCGCVQVLVGRPVVLRVTAFSAMPLSYQWFHNGKRLHGVTAAETIIPHAHDADCGAYRCEVSSPAGVVTTPDIRVSIRYTKVPWWRVTLL